MIACIIIMSISAFFVFYAMIGYPVLLLLINKIKKPKTIQKNYDYEPSISYMIVAHNEEKCIRKKLLNILELNYPLEKVQVLVASDFCTDKTDAIVEAFALEHPELTIVLNKSKEHKGKTNAQNETQKLASGEILVMTDANSIFERNALRELVACFIDEDVWYVCGQLKYSNEENETGESESFYWKYDLKQREIESNLQTITAGNGSIYAVKNQEYIDIKPIFCHDSKLPFLYGLCKKRCLYNSNAISFEKSGETNRDEFKRKIRMNRSILNIFVDMWKPINCFKYKWFSFFYFGHRTCRYLIWFNHLVFFIVSIVLTVMGHYIFGGILLGLQVLFVLLGLISINKPLKFKPLRIIGFYSLMVLSQLVAAFKQLTGQSKPIWEKAESTR